MMNKPVSIFVASAALVLASQPAVAAIGDFNLNADAMAYNLNDGSTFLHNPQSLMFSGAGSSGSVSSTTPSQVGVTATQNISASLTDAYNGSITYDDSWESTNLSSGQMRFGAISDYSFNVAAPATLNVNWAATPQHTGDGPANFGFYNIILYVDGTAYYSPSSSNGWTTPDTAGSWTVGLGSGDHTIAFQDFGNIYGGVGTRYDQMTERLDFSINASPVPEPSSLIALAVGGIAILQRRRRVRG